MLDSAVMQTACTFQDVPWPEDAEDFNLVLVQGGTESLSRLFYGARRRQMSRYHNDTGDPKQREIMMRFIIPIVILLQYQVMAPR